MTTTSKGGASRDDIISRARREGMTKDELDPRTRFRQVAEKRVSTAVDAIRLLGNMAGGNTFDIHLSDVENMQRFLQSELDIAMSKLKGEKPNIGSMVWDR